jgi:hypothetical protein
MVPWTAGDHAAPIGDSRDVHDAASGWFHPVCGADQKAIVEALPVTHPASNP